MPYMGKILRVDLTEGKITTVDTSNYAPKFIGGRGIGAKIIWDEVPPEVGAFDPENRLVFMTGPAAGTLIPGGNRLTCQSKAPQTFPIESYAWSSMGGFFAGELKRAGYDGIIIQGAAQTLSYIAILDKDVDIIPAPMLKGATTWDTELELKRRHGEKARVLSIGPAGENKCRNATIESDCGHGFGECGFGGVMGSKNLKAIVVRGTGYVKVPNKGEHLELVKYIYDRYLPKVKEPPLRGIIYGPGGITASQLYYESQVGNVIASASGCEACGYACQTVYRFKDDPTLSGSSMCVDTAVYVAPEMRYYGGRPSGRVAWLGTMLVQRLGINAYEFSFTYLRESWTDPPTKYPPDGVGGCLWLWQGYKEGIFTEKNTGLPWSKFGSKEFLEALAYGWAYRRGPFMKLLGEGIGRASAYIRDHPEEFGLTKEQGMRLWEIYQWHFPRAGNFGGYPAHHTRCGCGTPLGHSRVTPAHLMLTALSPRDYSSSHDATQMYSCSGGDEQRKEIGVRLFGDEKALFVDWPDEKDPKSPTCWSSKGKVTRYCELRAIKKDSITICDFLGGSALTYTKTADGKYSDDLDIASKIFRSVTGIAWTEAELDKAAERVRNLERAIAVRDGRTRADDTLFDCWFDAPDRVGKVVDRAEWKKAMDEYYTVMGWDLVKGWPTRAKLEELDLKDVADALEALGKLP